MNNAQNCNHFVDALGLKTLFAAFMKVEINKYKCVCLYVYKGYKEGEE